MIPRRITAAFPPDVQRRGEQYFRSQRVRVVRASAVNLTAMVAGTIGYLVDIAAEPGLMTALCSCPYAADNGVCKHIWATLRFAEAGRQLDALVGTAGKNAGFETLGDEELEDFEDDDDYDDGELPALFESEASATPLRTFLPPAAAHRPTSNPRMPRAKERAPEWKTLLDGAQRSMRNPASYDAPAQWPADRRLVYLIDLAATRWSRGLVVELATDRLGK